MNATQKQSTCGADMAPKEAGENPARTEIYWMLGPAIRESITRMTVEPSRKHEDVLSFEAGRQEFLLRHDYGNGLHLLWITPEGRARYDVFSSFESGRQELRDCIRFAAGITKRDRMVTHCRECAHPRRLFEGTLDFRCGECGCRNHVSIDTWTEQWYGPMYSEGGA